MSETNPQYLKKFDLKKTEITVKALSEYENLKEQLQIVPIGYYEAVIKQNRSLQAENLYLKNKLNHIFDYIDSLDVIGSKNKELTIVAAKILSFF